MKLIIADMASTCFPEDITIGKYDADSTARIKSQVMAQIKTDGRSRKYALRKLISTVVLAAAFIMLLAATACALGLFGLNRREVPSGETVRGTWTEENAFGHKFETGMYYDEAGMVFTYDCSGTPHLIRFKPGWVPAEIEILQDSNIDEEGWYSYCGNWSDPTGAIPYTIGIHYAAPGFQLVVNGEVTVLKEELWDSLAVIALSSVWGNGPCRETNYLILFSPEDGYMLTVGGTANIETLEHIAREIEIKVTEEPFVYNPAYNIGILNVGRG